jgi:hypothetical protein
LDALAEELKRVDSLYMKLIGLNFGVVAFLFVGFVSRDASLSVFGISLKDFPGMKEFLVGLVTTVSIFNLFISTSRETMQHVVNTVIDSTLDQKLAPFAKLAYPTAFHLKIYAARAFDRWVFPRFSTKLLTIVIGILVVSWFLLLLSLSIALSLLLCFEIYKNPSLGNWSIAVLWYVALGWVIALLWLVRMNLPLPYSDQGILKKLRELQETDPVEYRILLKQIFPNNRPLGTLKKHRIDLYAKQAIEHAEERATR